MSKKKKPLPPSSVLEKLGLTREEVRAAFNVETPEHEKPLKKGYLFLREQVKMRKRMKRYEKLIFAKFEAGLNPTIIAGCLGVSEETVRVRLRRKGCFATNPTDVVK
jgi:DNA-directed RNA polymerase specialized sigma24 family protein